MNRCIVQVGNYQAAYQVMGKGPTLVFLHGFLGNGDNWGPLCSQLSDNYQCIAIDLLGFGQSSKPKLRYTIWHQIEFIQGFLEALDLQKFHLVGHSYGGWLSAAYTIAASGIGWSTAKTAWSTSTPSLCPLPMPQSITMLAPAGIRDDSFVGRYRYMRPLLWENALVTWGMALIKPIAAIMGKLDAFQQIDQARIALQTQPVAKSFLMDRLRPEDAIDTVERFLEHIRIPTLVIAGQQDTTIPLWHCETYGNKIAQAKFHSLDDAEHNLIQSHTEIIIRLIQQHLEQTHTSNKASF